jgi:heptosyltransferase II
MSTGRTIVVVAHHGLGDLLMTVPLLRACDRTLGAGDRLAVLVKSRVEAEVLDLLPTTSRLETYVIEGAGRARLARVARVAMSLRRRRPLALLAPHATDGPGMALVTRSIGARCAVGPGGRFAHLGFHRTVEVEPDMHKVRYFLRFAEAAGLSVSGEPDVRLAVPSADREEARRRLPGGPPRRWVAIAPGSGVIESHKRWPATQFRELIRRLLAHSPALSILLFGSPSEAELLHSLEEAGGRCLVAAEGDVKRALALLSECDAVVTGCSGASHMAAAVDVPIVGLYGPTNPGFTGPFSTKLRTLRAGLVCSPCYRKEFTRGCGDPVCMSAIAPDTVFAAVLDSLAGTPSRRAPWLATTNATGPAEPVRAAS